MIPRSTLEWLTWKLHKNFKSQGIRGTVRVAMLKAWDTVDNMRGIKHRLLREERAFDKQHHVRTNYLVEMTDLEDGDRAFGNAYQPTSPAQLREILGALPIKHSDFVFVDLGSGMGRCLFIAAEFPFRKVVGVEYSAELHRIAMENLKTFRSKSRKCQDIQMVRSDAAEFRPPDQDTVFYLFNPFQKEVLEKVVENITQSLAGNPRRVLIVYLNPLHASVVEVHAVWQKTKSSEPSPGRYSLVVYQNRAPLD